MLVLHFFPIPIISFIPTSPFLTRPPRNDGVLFSGRRFCRLESHQTHNGRARHPLFDADCALSILSNPEKVRVVPYPARNAINEFRSSADARVFASFDGANRLRCEK